MKNQNKTAIRRNSRKIKSKNERSLSWFCTGTSI